MLHTTYFPIARLMPAETPAASQITVSQITDSAMTNDNVLQLR